MNDNIANDIATGHFAAPGFVYVEGYTRDLALRSVGSGWASLINDLFDHINNGHSYLKITQVKEKFGTLRIYWEGATKEDYDFIAALERSSEAICEDCGKPGSKTIDGRWILTLCQECKIKLGRT